MSDVTPTYVLRAATLDDEAFIFSAWIRGAWEPQPNCWVPWQLWRRGYEEAIRGRMANNKTMVMCHPDDPSMLMGFICYRKVGEVLAVHWLYVVAIMQCQGIGRSVIETLGGKVYSTEPSKALSWLRRKGVVYDPFA